MADFQAQWKALFRKWCARLLPAPGWTLHFIPDDDCQNEAEITHRFRYREATMRFRPSVQPSDMLVCHEVCHVLVARLYVNALELLQGAGDAVGFAKRAIDGATEEMVEDLARAFVRAYRKSDNQPRRQQP